MPTVKGGGIGNSMYLVIGANGFLGSYVIKNILENTEKNDRTFAVLITFLK